MKKVFNRIRWTLLHLLLTDLAQFRDSERLTFATLRHSIVQPSELIRETEERILMRLVRHMIREGFVEIEQRKLEEDMCYEVRARVFVFKPEQR